MTNAKRLDCGRFTAALRTHEETARNLMDEKPKNLWKRSFTGRTALITWLAVAVFTVMLGCFIAALASYNGPLSDRLMTVMLFAGAFLIACLMLVYVGWPLLRWLLFKHWRRMLFALACFATLIALFYAEENWRGKHEWEKFKREWEAKGEHFDMASLAPVPVLDDQNFALTSIAFTSYGQLLTRDGKRIPYDTNFVARMRMPLTHDYNSGPTNGPGNREKGQFTNLKDWQHYYRELAAKTNEFAVPAQPQSPAADVLLALGKYNPVIEELRAASRLPYSRFPLQYTNEPPGSILLPHLAALKSSAQVLQLRSIAELQNSQPEKALNDVILGLQMIDKIRTEPFLISQLVRIAMLQIMLQAVWEGLAQHQWSDGQLVELDQALTKFDFLTDYKAAMRGDRACVIGGVEYLQRDRSLRKLAEFFNLYNNGNEDTSVPTLAIVYHFSPSGWVDQNKLRIGQFETQWYLPLADVENRMVSPKSVESANDAFNKQIGTTQLNPYNWFEKKFVPALAQAVKKFAYAQSSVDLACVAIALERYRLAHGEFPESLNTLAPQFMEKIPHDIINGQPLNYRRTDDGQFVLYSVGWNELDDGGVVVFEGKNTDRVDINQGDWVWRYPAK